MNTIDQSEYTLKTDNLTRLYANKWVIFIALIFLFTLLPGTSFAMRPGGGGGGGGNGGGGGGNGGGNGGGGSNNAQPVAAIANTSDEGIVPYTVTFDGSRSGDRDGSISAYNWDFGDGNVGSGEFVTHTFNTDGNFVITLTVTDNEGATDSASTNLTLVVAPDSEPIGSRPVGIYSLDNVVDKPFVSGVAKRLSWSDIEPEEGVYDFRFIENAIHDAELVGQSVTLVNMLIREPDWLINKVAREDLIEGVLGTDIVPWNETMLQALEKLIEAQSNFIVDGVPLKDHPTLKQVAASIGTINSIRLTTLPQNYDPELFKQSATNSIRLWADAFPKQHIYVGLFGVSDGLNTAVELRDDLLAEFNGINQTRINFFVETWTGKIPNTTNATLYDIRNETSLMLQACGSWTGQYGEWAQCDWVTPQDTPEKGFNFAMDNFNSTYFEIYEEDLNNPSYTQQFEDAAIKIQELADSLD